jgi:hypothetical protein
MRGPANLCHVLAVTILMAGNAPSVAIAGSDPGPSLVFAAHGGGFITTDRWLFGRVTEIGLPAPTATTISFGVEMPNLSVDQLRGWRVVFLSGELFGLQFWVHSNTKQTITVEAASGLLTGLAVGDDFLVEGPFQPSLDPPAERLPGGNP